MIDSRFYQPFAPIKLSKIAEQVGIEIKGDKEIVIEEVASLLSASKHSLTFFTNVKYLDQLLETKAGACIIAPEFVERAPAGVSLLLSKNPYATYAKVLALLFAPKEADNEGYISPKAVIDPAAKLGKGVWVGDFAIIEARAEIGDYCHIGPFCHIAQNCVIGNQCRLSSHVVIQYTIMGERNIIHPGVKIGQDGFGFATHHGFHHKVLQLGRVLIGNDVEIGANTCIDRGSSADTVIGDNCMIDNLVQIAHNVEIKKGSVIVAQVGIAGSTKIGQYVVLGGQVGVAGHIIIGDNVQVAAKSGIAKSLASNESYGGIPAIPIKNWRRLVAFCNRIAKTGGLNGN